MAYVVVYWEGHESMHCTLDGMDEAFAFAQQQSLAGNGPVEVEDLTTGKAWTESEIRQLFRDDPDLDINEQP